MSDEYVVPPNVLDDLREVPEDRPVAVLLRHSVRDEIPPGADGDDVPITDAGVRIARGLGEQIGDRLAGIRASPLRRCIQTGEAVRGTAGVDCEIADDTMLGDPGAYVADAEQSEAAIDQLGAREVMRRLVAGDETPDGWHHGPSATRRLADHTIAHSSSDRGLHLFVSHRLLVAVFGALALDGELADEHDPHFLDGLFVWEPDDREGVTVRYNGRNGRLGG